MEIARPQEYGVQIALHPLKHAQYTAAVQNAVARLRWPVVAVSGNTIVCQTPDNEQTFGEHVSLTIDGEYVTLRSSPVNEYYGDETQNKANADMFRQAIALAIEDIEKADRNLHPMHREKWGALVPSKSYLVTPVIVYMNVVLFITMVIAGISPLQPTAQSLLQWGGNFRPAVGSGEWWRLITYMFLHGGAVHLFMNTYALLYIGMFLEPLLGRFRFVSAYLLTGVCAGLMSIAVHAFSVGVGASGAIFGMYGVFLSMLTTTHIQRTMRRTMLRSIMFFVVFNLLYGLQGNTDNAAHIGGLISGFIIGYIYYPGIAARAPISRQMLVTAVVAVVVVLLGVGTVVFFR